MVKNPFEKRKPFLFTILFAISLSFLFLPFDIESCSVPKSERVGPVLRKGKIIGFRIYSIRKKNFLSYLGIKKNDMITNINDEKISDIIGNENKFKVIKEEFNKTKHIKLKLLRKKSAYTIEVILNPKNISKIKNPPCSDYEIDQSIPKKEMFDFYEMKKIE